MRRPGGPALTGTVGPWKAETGPTLAAAIGVTVAAGPAGVGARSDHVPPFLFAASLAPAARWRVVPAPRASDTARRISEDMEA